MQSLLYITAPFTMFSHFYTPFELAHAIRLSKCTRIFVQPKFLPLVQAAAKETGFPSDRVYLLEGTSAGLRSFGSMIDEVREKNVPTVDVRPAKKDTLAYLIFSSGTSGLPKGALHAANCVVSTTETSASCYDITRQPLVHNGSRRRARRRVCEGSHSQYLLHIFT